MHVFVCLELYQHTVCQRNTQSYKLLRRHKSLAYNEELVLQITQWQGLKKEYFARLRSFLSTYPSVWSKKEQLCDVIILFRKVKIWLQDVHRKDEAKTVFVGATRFIWNVQIFIIWGLKPVKIPTFSFSWNIKSSFWLEYMKCLLLSEAVESVMFSFYSDFSQLNFARHYSANFTT